VHPLEESLLQLGTSDLGVAAVVAVGFIFSFKPDIVRDSFSFTLVTVIYVLTIVFFFLFQDDVI